MDMTTRTAFGGVGKALGVGSLALLTAALLVLGGCAQAGTAQGSGSGPTNGSANSAAPTATPTIPLPPEPSLGVPTQGPDQVDAAGCHRNLVLTETAHSTYCVNLGGTLTLTLNGTADQRW